MNRFRPRRLAVAVVLTTVAMSPSVDARPPAVLDDHHVHVVASQLGLTVDVARSYVALTRDVGALQARGVAEFAATFAGVWREPRDGGLVHVAFTGDARSSADRLVAGFRRPDLVRVHTVAASLRDLETLAARVAADDGLWRDAGVVVGSVGVDVVTNAVAVTTASSLPAAVAFAARRYPGAHVSVRPGAAAVPASGSCQSHAFCPLEADGGIALHGAVGMDVFACTSGFGAVQVSTGAPVLLTAGHCFVNGTVVTHNGIPIGQVTRRTWPSGDAAVIAQVQPVYPRTNSVLWRTPGSSVNVLAVVGRGVTEAVGAPVCRTGVTTEVRCGVITALNVTVNYITGDTVHGLTQTSACSQPGDSGGPFMDGNDAYGLTSGGTVGPCAPGVRSYYYPAHRVEAALGVRINT